MARIFKKLISFSMKQMLDLNVVDAGYIKLDVFIISPYQRTLRNPFYILDPVLYTPSVAHLTAPPRTPPSPAPGLAPPHAWVIDCNTVDIGPASAPTQHLGLCRRPARALTQALQRNHVMFTWEENKVL